ARLDTYRCRDAKSGAARETRAGAKRGCLKQLCATTILKNAVRDMLIRNLEKGQSLVDNGVLDWDLDINK
ncbi:hypothetical protein ACB377_32750, partial [Klebsiella michiganensis]